MFFQPSSFDEGFLFSETDIVKDIFDGVAHTAIIVHILLGMSLASIIQFYKTRYKNLKWIERFLNSIVSSFFVVCFSLPLLDFYPQLPPSIALLIGGFCGSFGTHGIQDILQRVLDKFLPRQTPYEPYEQAINGSHVRYDNTKPRKSERQFKTVDDEPPMPDDMRDR